MPLCDEPMCERAGSLFLAAEDSAEHTIAPRMRTTGGDMRRCFVSETIRLGDHERPIRLPDDIEAMERTVKANDIGLIVVDPFLGFLSQSVDSHKDQSVRDVLHRLNCSPRAPAQPFSPFAT